VRQWAECGDLAKHAEAVYGGLPSDEHRKLSRALVLRLIEPGATEQDTTRRRTALTELTLTDSAQTDAMRTVVDAFVRARLLTTDRIAEHHTVEVSHEALIREWTRLGEWLREAREDIGLQGNLSADADEWARRGHREDDPRLYAGELLEEAQAWAARNTPSAAEVAFLTASANRQIREGERKRQRQRTLHLTRFAFVGIVLLALIGGLIGSFLALINIRAERDTAET
jgi:hypothetical protein